METRRIGIGILAVGLFIVAVIAVSTTPTPQPTKMIVSTEVPNIPSKPEDIIDARVLPAWKLMASSTDPQVRIIAQFILNNHLKIYIDPQVNDDKHAAVFNFRCEDNPPKYAGDVGEIGINEKLFDRNDPEELAGFLIHETTHALQRVKGKSCSCTMDGEFEAYFFQISFWMEVGRGDLIMSDLGIYPPYDSSGYLDKNKLWQSVKSLYPECFDNGNPFATTAMPLPIPTPQYIATSEPNEDLYAPGARYMIDDYGQRVPYIEGKGTLQIAGYYQAPNGKWYPIGPPSTTQP